MKKGLIILIPLITIIIFMMIRHYYLKGSYANDVDSPEIILLCGNNKVNPDEAINCTISAINYDSEVSSFRTKITLDSALINPEYTKSTIWEGAVDGGIIDLYTDVNKTGNFEIASFTVFAEHINDGKNATITLSDTYVGDNNFDEVAIDNIVKNIRINSNINTLSNLEVTNSNIVFNRNINSYEDTINSDVVTISASTDDINSVITGDIGTKSLSYGLNTFNIIVTSESGIANVYVLKLTRPDILTFSDNININTIDDVNYIYDLKDGLLVSTLNSFIVTSGDIVIKNNRNDILNADNIIGTGNKMSILLSNNNVQEYTLIVRGDVTGDGNIGVNDVAKLFQHYRKTNIISDYSYIKAGDVKTDNVISLNDVTKLFQYIRSSNVDKTLY